MQVKIAGKRFEYGDTQISIIGVLADMPEQVVKENLNHCNRLSLQRMVDYEP